AGPLGKAPPEAEAQHLRRGEERGMQRRMNMREVVIVKALRTAIGSFGGTLKDLTAPQLAAVVIRRILEETNLPPEEIDEVILGNVLQAAAGQNPARQAAMEAGIPETVPAYTINKVCGS